MSKVKEINEYIKNIPNETYLKETDYDKNLMKELYDIEKKPFVIDYKKNDNNQILDSELDSESDSELELSTISDSTRGGKKIKKRKSLKRKTMKSKKTKKSRKTKKTRKSKKRNSRRKSYN